MILDEALQRFRISRLDDCRGDLIRLAVLRAHDSRLSLRSVLAHFPVEVFAVVNIYKMPTTVPRWQWRKVSC